MDLDMLGLNEQSHWEDTVLDAYMAFFPGEHDCLLEPALKPAVQPDTSIGSSASGTVNYSRTEPCSISTSINTSPYAQQATPSGSSGMCPSFLPRAEPCAGPGHELGMPGPEPEDPWSSLPPPVIPMPPRIIGAGAPQWDAPQLTLCTTAGGGQPRSLGGSTSPSQEHHSSERLAGSWGGRHAHHSSEPLAGVWGGGGAHVGPLQEQGRGQPHQHQHQHQQEEDDLLLAATAATAPANAVSGPLMLSLEDLSVDNLHELPMLPLRQGNLSCSDLPSLAAAQPHGSMVCSGATRLASGQGCSLSHAIAASVQPAQPQPQQHHLHTLHWEPHQAAAAPWQPPQAVVPPYPPTYQRSISYGDTLLPQPAQHTPLDAGQQAAKLRPKLESSPEVVMPPKTQSMLTEQQQQQQQQQQGRQSRTPARGAAGTRKKKSPPQPKLEVVAAGMKAGGKAGARAKQGRSASTKPYRDKNRDNKFLIISLEQELQEKLSLAADLECQNLNLRQRERILSMGVSSCEHNLQMRQNGEKLSSYLMALLQSFKSEINMVTARKVITSMANIACDKEMTIDLFRESWRALTSEISDALMKEGPVVHHMGAITAANARLSQVTSKVVDYIMAVYIRQKHLVQQAIGTDMFTGQEASVDDDFWAGIAQQLDPTADQIRDLAATKGMFSACHNKNILEREALKERLAKALERDQLEANKVAQSRVFVEVFQTVLSLERNLRRLNTLHVLASFMTLKILTPLQICKLTVLSLPAFPNFVALLMVLGSLEPATAQAQASCPLQGETPEEEEPVDKWGLGF